MSRFVAVGDIHGCSQTLAKLLEILDLRPGDSFLSTGDLSSKGEDSRGVHSQLLDLEQRGVNLIVLLGNHEAMLLAIQQIVGADEVEARGGEILIVPLVEGHSTSDLIRGLGD